MTAPVPPGAAAPSAVDDSAAAPSPVDAGANGPSSAAAPALPQLPPRVVGAPEGDRGRSRAGNAMERTRTGLYDGARASLAKYGPRKTTMADVAKAAGVAKATLYNHFRTKPDLLLGLAGHDVAALLAEMAAAGDPVEALTAAASRVAEHPVVRRVAAEEPALLAAIVLPDGPGREVWATAREGVAHVVGADDAELVLRWLSSYLLAPASREEISTAAARLVRALRRDEA